MNKLRGQCKWRDSARYIAWILLCIVLWTTGCISNGAPSVTQSAQSSDKQADSHGNVRVVSTVGTASVIPQTQANDKLIDAHSNVHVVSTAGTASVAQPAPQDDNHADSQNKALVVSKAFPVHVDPVDVKLQPSKVEANLEGHISDLTIKGELAPLRLGGRIDGDVHLKTDPIVVTKMSVDAVQVQPVSIQPIRIEFAPVKISADDSRTIRIESTTAASGSSGGGSSGGMPGGWWYNPLTQFVLMLSIMVICGVLGGSLNYLLLYRSSSTSTEKIR